MRRRARGDEQKEERREAMLSAAWALFAESPYEAIGMADVATRVGLAKGTLYLYFATKEALFLAVQERQLGAWFDAVDARLRALGDDCDPAAVVDLLTVSLTERPALARLLTILHTTLEQNVEYATALQFKRSLLARLHSTGALLERCLPFLAPGEGGRTLLRLYALVIGLWQLADPAPVARQVLREPGLEPFAIDFAGEFSTTARLLFAGLDGRGGESRGAGDGRSAGGDGG